MFRYDTKFKAFYGIITRFPRAVVVFALVLALASLVYTANEITFLTGRDDLMPKNSGFHADYMSYRTEFGDAEEIVVVMEGPTQKVVQFGEELQQRLQGGEGIRNVFFPPGLDFFKKNGLLFLSTKELRDLSHNLVLLRPILKDVAASPSVETLFSSMTNRMERYLAGKGAGDDLAGTVMLLKALGNGLAQFEQGGPPSDLGSFLAGEGAGALNAGEMQVLTVLPVKDPASFVPAEQAIQTVRKAIDSMREKQEYRGLTAGLTGTPVLEYEEMVTSLRDMNLALVVSLVATIVLLLLAFRGILNVAAAMVSLLIAISISFGLATLLIGHLNILSMVFAVMLVGLGIEYGIQLVLRYQEELLKGEPPVSAIGTGLHKNMWSIVMAAVTTAAAFLTFAFTDFKGIAELGIIASAGVFTCVLVTFTVLPALLVLMAPWKGVGRRGKEKSSRGEMNPQWSNPKFFHRVRHVVFGTPRRTVAVATIVLIVCGYFASGVSFDYNLMNLQAKGLESVGYAYRLMTNSQNPGFVAVAMAAAPEEARQKARAFESLATVDHVVTLEKLVPEDQSEKLVEVERIRMLLADITPTVYEGEMNPLALPKIFEGFRATTEKLKMRLAEMKRPEQHEVAAFLKKLDSFFASLEKNRETSARGMLENFQGGLLAALPEQIGSLKESLPTRPVGIVDIPEELKTRFVGKSGYYLLQIAPKGLVFDREPLQAFILDLKQVDPHVTGEPVMVYESMTVMRDAYKWAFIYAFLAVIIILFITFRSVRYTLIGLSMLGAGVLLMVGTMGLFGMTFNSANIIVMPLILGVGIDSGIYIINRYRRENETPEQVVMSSAGTGVILNTLTILASFGALMVAHHRGVFSIGAIMSIGMIACLVVFVVVLPAVLSLWGRKELVVNDGK